MASYMQNSALNNVFCFWNYYKIFRGTLLYFQRQKKNKQLQICDSCSSFNYDGNEYISTALLHILMSGSILA